MTEHIVATFETDAAADAAVRDLTSAGISSSAIRRYRPTSLADTSHQSAGATASSGGFWAWLLGEEPAGETTRSLYRDEEFYQRGAQAGHSVVSVELGDEQFWKRIGRSKWRRIRRAVELISRLQCLPPLGRLIFQPARLAAWGRPRLPPTTCHPVPPQAARTRSFPWPRSRWKLESARSTGALRAFDGTLWSGPSRSRSRCVASA
jgi:hypothetical protein